MTTTNTCNNSVAFYLFVIFVTIYVLTSSFVNISQFDVSLMRLEVIKSIIERFELSVPQGTGVTGVDGIDYSWFGFGSILLSLPFCILGKIVNIQSEIVVCLINPFFAAATVVLVFLFCTALGYSRRASVYTSFVYGLGTMAWYYAKDPGDHAFETFFILLSVFFTYQFIKTEKVGRLLASGIALGIAGLCRPTSFMVVIPLLLMIGARPTNRQNYWQFSKVIAKNGSQLLFSLLPFIGVFFWYNKYRFGSIFESGYSLIAQRTGTDLFGTSFFTGILGLLASPGKGFFYYSPIALLFFCSIRSFWKKHSELSICFTSMMALYIIFFSKYLYWHGDWAWGPRYLFTLTPFFIIPVVDVLEAKLQSQNNFAKRGIYVLFLVSLLIQVVSVSVNAYGYFRILQTEKHVRFTVDYVPGVQPIKEPVTETYFNWKLSPILVQTGMMCKIIKNISATPTSSEADEIKQLPTLNYFDFWWSYIYYCGGNKAILYAVPLFLAIILRAAYKLKNSIV